MLKNPISLSLVPASILAFAVSVSIVPAAQPREREDDQDSKYAQVDLFGAMDEGEIEVQFIPKDSRAGNVLIRNNTEKPLRVKLPASFAGVPVLAQAGLGGGIGGGGFGGGIGGGGLGGGGLGGGGLGGGQGLGGGFGGGGLGGGGLGGGGFGGGGLGGGGFGGFFNVAPEKVRKIEVNLVCLEHGKKEPTPRMKYKLVPIESVTKDRRVIALCGMVGRGEVPQNVAQAAAWRLANGLTWQQLALKNRVATRFQTVRYFNMSELRLAERVVNEVHRRAESLSGPEASLAESRTQ